MAKNRCKGKSCSLVLNDGKLLMGLLIFIKTNQNNIYMTNPGFFTMQCMWQTRPFCRFHANLASYICLCDSIIEIYRVYKKKRDPTCRLLSSFIANVLCVIFHSCYSTIYFLLNESLLVQFEQIFVTQEQINLMRSF